MEECSICTENLEENSHELECGHTFHAACICNWFRRGSGLCPNCRDPGKNSSLCWRDSRARASALRRCSYRASAPDSLKRLVASLKREEEKSRLASQDYRIHKSNNKEILKESLRLRGRVWKAKQRVRNKIRILGTFASRDFPLPNIDRNLPQIEF